MVYQSLGATLLPSLLVLCRVFALVSAYIPATATDDLDAAGASGLDVSEDGSTIVVRWGVDGSLILPISYYLAVKNSPIVSQGAFVDLSEDNLTSDSPATRTPWVAFVSCDANSSSMSTDTDIFTLAKSKGAVAGLLYSLESAACLIDPSFAGHQPFDILATQSRSSGQLIAGRFGQNDAPYSKYDATKLDESYDDIQAISAGNTPAGANYLWAQVDAYNASASGAVWTQPQTALPTETGAGAASASGSAAPASGDIIASGSDGNGASTIAGFTSGR
ncbi:hypothetical protein HDZ31DRAFT_67355 [Schizophyllum fasciatum]